MDNLKLNRFIHENGCNYEFCFNEESYPHVRKIAWRYKIVL